jgi:cobaltochelatase CobS
MATKQFSLAEAFDPSLPAAILIEGEDAPMPFTPAVNPNYRFWRELLRAFVMFWKSGDTALYLNGHKGTGKSTLVEQFHARLNLPLLAVCAHRNMEMADLLGHFVMKPDGSMAFHYGPVSKAAKEGWSVLLDEANALDPGVFLGLHALLEGASIYLPETEEVIVPQRSFRVFVACNPNDHSGVYQGRNTQDAATHDRFWFITVPYASPGDEVPLVDQELARAGNWDEQQRRTLAAGMVEVANKIRVLFAGSSDASNAITVTMTTRTLLRWAKAMLLCKDADRMGLSPVHEALKVAFTNGPIEPQTRIALHDIVTQVFGVADPSEPCAATVR